MARPPPASPGDLAIYNWNGGPPDHIGIVERAGSGGAFTAIEGNTSVGNESDGGEVMRRNRTLADVDGFGRLTFPERPANDLLRTRP